MPATIHAKDVDFGVATQGFSLCGIYSLHLSDDPAKVTCKNCLKKKAAK